MSNIPYFDEIIYINNEIGDIDINYMPIESAEITKMLKIRDEKEKKAFRVTSLVKNDYLFEKTPINKKYFATYMHDKVLDVACNYFQKCGLSTNKEKFIDSLYKNRKIKGHCDIIIHNNHINMLGEVKNYLESTVNKDEFMYFIHQILTYCYCLHIKIAYLIINNPKKYKDVSVFKINISNKNEKYIKDYISRSLIIQDYIDTFKYNKSNI